MHPAERDRIHYRAALEKIRTLVENEQDESCVVSVVDLTEILKTVKVWSTRRDKIHDHENSSHESLVSDTKP